MVKLLPLGDWNLSNGQVDKYGAVEIHRNYTN